MVRVALPTPPDTGAVGGFAAAGIVWQQGFAHSLCRTHRRSPKERSTRFGCNDNRRFISPKISQPIKRQLFSYLALPSFSINPIQETNIWINILMLNLKKTLLCVPQSLGLAPANCDNNERLIFLFYPDSNVNEQQPEILQ